jgi:hypothetical protein
MKGGIDRMDAGYGRCRPCQSHGNPVENALRFPPAFHRSLEKPRGFRPGSFPQGLGKPRGGLVPPQVSHTSHSPYYGYLPPKRWGKDRGSRPDGNRGASGREGDISNGRNKGTFLKSVDICTRNRRRPSALPVCPSFLGDVIRANSWPGEHRVKWRNRPQMWPEGSLSA